MSSEIETRANLDIAALTRAARQGAQSAYAALYRRFLPLVHGILLSRFRPALADELSQDCFAQAFAELNQLHDAAKFGPWIATIARRIKPREARAEQAWEAWLDPVDPQSSPEDRSDAERVLQALASLPEAYRETLSLRLIEGLSGPEIAELTGLGADSVRVNLHRGMAKLRERLGLQQDPLRAGAYS